MKGVKDICKCVDCGKILYGTVIEDGKTAVFTDSKKGRCMTCYKDYCESRNGLKTLAIGLGFTLLFFLGISHWVLKVF